MKHYKIVNLNEAITQKGGGNLIVMSYNVSWEAMTSTTAGNFKLCASTGLGDGICKLNILLNISTNIKKYNPDFVTIQEASEHNSIVELFDSDLYDSYINMSEKETMLSLWNKKKFNLVNSYDAEFDKGRPYVILILENNRTKKNIALINLHGGHNTDTQQNIFDKINDFIKTKIKLQIKKSITRVIMSGDFNRDVYEDSTSNYIIKFVDDFALHRFSNKKQTCCSTIGYGHKFVYDHILDSKATLEKTILGNGNKNYKVPSSDHILIIGKLKN
jgi:hypothetical protein